MDNKHALLIIGDLSGLSTDPHLAIRILILQNGKWHGVDIHIILEQNT